MDVLNINKLKQIQRDAKLMDRQMMLGLSTGVMLSGSFKLPPDEAGGVPLFDGTLFSSNPYRPHFSGVFVVPLKEIKWAAIMGAGESWESFRESLGAS